MADILIHQRYHAVDGESVGAALQAVFGVGTAAVQQGEALQYDQVSIVDDGASFTRISSDGSAVGIEAVAAPDLVAFLVRTGRLEITQGAERLVLVEGDLGLVPIGQATSLSWKRVEIDAFSFPPSTVGRLLGDGAHPLRLQVTRRVAESALLVSLWRRTAASLAGEVLQHRELFESDAVREQMIGALLGITIEAFGVFDAADERLADGRGTLAQAEQYIADHLADSISVPDIARAVGVSVRGLQLAYQRGGQRTPLLHLRGKRMDAARAAFTAVGAGRPASVTAVARRLGYTNLGRFSAHYRDAFGESPSATLRRPVAQPLGGAAAR